MKTDFTVEGFISELKNISGVDIPDEVMAEIKFNERHKGPFHRGRNWNGYNVFITYFKNGVVNKYPYVILAKPGSVHLSSKEESDAYEEFVKNIK